jgi:type II secretory pathway pseudopilin PulG
MYIPHTQRSAFTIVEVILYMGIVAIMSGTIIPMLVSATESRQRQDAIALVEQNGQQLIQSIIIEVRNAERIIEPSTGSSGIILTLQHKEESKNPTIFALSDGALVMIQGKEKSILSSPLVGVTSFAVDNVSPSDNRGSITVVLNVRRIIRLFRPLEYNAQFDTIYLQLKLVTVLLHTVIPALVCIYGKVV